MSAYSLIDMVKFLFTIPGVKSFLSERVSQDPLEKYFGRQRQRGRVNENPTCSQFIKNNEALRVVSSIKINFSKGNTRATNEQKMTSVSNSPLPKRKRNSTESMEAVTKELTSTCTGNKPDLLSIVSEALIDSGFNIPSAEAFAARETAEKIKARLLNPQTKQAILPYEAFLLQIFDLWTLIPPETSKIREQIWRRFCMFTSSDDYQVFWKSFYSATEIQSSSVLSFFITYTLFIRQWMYKYPKNSQYTTESQLPHLTYEEQNLLWYVAGYVLKKVRGEMKGKEWIMDSFIEESTDSDNIEIEDDCDAQNWLHIIDRGGLTKCNNDFYIFLRAVELEMTSILSQKSLESASLGHPKVISETLEENTSITDAWDNLISPLDVPDSSTTDTIKSKILKLYIKMRSFAFQNKKMEQYKQSNKENIQKTKSLRSKLNSLQQKQNT